MNQYNDELDDVIDALSVKNNSSYEEEDDSEIVQQPALDTPYNATEVLNKTLQEIQDLVASNKDVLDEAKKLIIATGDAEFFEAYSSIGKAQTEAFKNLVKIISDKEKHEVLKKVKLKEIKVKEKLVNFQIGQMDKEKGALPAGSTLNQTNIVITGSREEALEFIAKEKEKQTSDRNSKESTEKPPIDI